MRILFIGNVQFSEKALKKLLDLKKNIVGVITKKSSKFNSDFVNLAPIAQRHHIPYLYVRDINTPTVVEFIKNLSPDVIYCFGWSQLLGKEILSIPKIGTVGFHPAELPKNRGRHPLIWALFLGLEQTASTFFWIDEGIDSGDILSQRIVPIYYEDDASSLYERITNVALKQIEEFTNELEQGIIRRIPQDKSKANYWRKRSPIDGIIDFRMSSRAIYNLVRALTRPYPGAEIIYKGKAYKVWKVKEVNLNLPNIEPGKILKKEGKQILVKCYDNAILLLEHELPNKDLKEGDYFYEH